MAPTRIPDRKTAPTRRTAVGLILSTPLLAGCAGLQNSLTSGGDQPPPAGGPQQSETVGTGQVKVGLILPLSGTGNAGVAGNAMKNAAEMALAEFQNPNIQLLIKDDFGTTQGTQQAAQQVLDEGAEIILGPLFGLSVPAVTQVARPRNIPLIAFSTDSSVAGRGVYLLSFLPESDVSRIVDYSAGTGKRSFAALLPENAYGNVVETAFKQTVARKGGRIVAFEKYASELGQSQAVHNIAQALPQTEALLLADDGDVLTQISGQLVANGADLKRVQLLGTGLWDNPRVFSDPGLQGGFYAAPDPSGYRAFAKRYRGKYGQDPVRTATLSYDAVALVAALSKSPAGQRFTQAALTNNSGFTGVDGLFRFKGDGTNERGLAVLKAGPGGGTIVAPSAKSFAA